VHNENETLGGLRAATNTRKETKGEASEEKTGKKRKKSKSILDSKEQPKSAIAKSTSR